MPTPFYHLRVAEVLFEHPDLKVAACERISQCFPAFLLGNIAPDVQVISGQSREATHFYRLPMRENCAPAWEQMLSDQPALKPAGLRDGEQGVFISGYLCHLQADWFWVEQIFEPYFGPHAGWKNFRERLYLHNVLRAYLDFEILENLNGQVRSGLGQVDPKDWLPFVDLKHLKAWQAFLTEQLKPGAAIQTVEVFAARQGIAAEAYYRLLNTENELQQQIFDFFPEQNLHDFWENLITNNIALLNDLLTSAT
ncbi:MAG TPA: hypothetical protein DEH25_06465 [Chloroflexi bacterium]|nr:hypothetical protein [Chloroflexota bacterium]